MPNLAADNAAANELHHPPEQKMAMAEQPLPESPLAAHDPFARNPTGRPIVAAIGASAGGLEAIRAFFEALPADPGIAFVVIMHLSPDYPSELPSLISTRTTMAVSQVTETVEIEPNHIYVIPPNRRLLVTDILRSST